MTEVRVHTTPFAEPSLPTRLADLRCVDPGTGAERAVVVRVRRTVDAAGVDLPVPDATPSGWTATAGAVAALPAVDDAGRWLVGAGAGTGADWRGAGAAAVRVAVGRSDPGALFGADGDGPARLLVLADDEHPGPDDDAAWAAFATGLLLGSHRFGVKSSAPAPPPQVRVVVPTARRAAVERAWTLARATATARDLADTPSGAKSPAWFADTAVRLLAATPGAGGLTTTIRDEAWLARERFGGVLAVGGGSARPPRLLELAWEPAGAAAHVVLVGKGITFDTGGISIKPNAGMADMRTDCSGGAAVVAALGAAAALGLPVRVTGLVPLAENHVSGSAYRPGDVVRHRDGTTTEVTNTDAEGRMVLADALGYAVEGLAPDVIVDVATLTGAMKVALGVRTGGVFATGDDLAARVVDAGAATGEAWWRMPLAADHVPDVDSTLADVRQAPAGPGGVMAALFLARFTGTVPWVHLDIAGPARCDGPYAEVAKGATGFSARTLAEFCARWA